MSKNFHSSMRINIESKRVIEMEKDFSSTSSKNLIKHTSRFTENITTSVRQQQVTCEWDKENRILIESEASGSLVKKMKVHYEELSVAKKRTNVPNGPQCPTVATGAIKKRKNSESQVEFEKERNIVPKKRPSIREDDSAFAKSRFKVYTDQGTKIDGVDSKIERTDKKSEEKSENTTANKSTRYFVTDKRLDRIKLPELSEKRQARVTPIEIPPVPPTIKKVKVLYRDRLMSKTDKPTIYSACHDLTYELPYDDYFIQNELEKEISISNRSRNLRQRNVTIGQRKIIVKFLTRLNSHLFLPSFLLYQTVKLFDAFLDLKIVQVTELQLIALSAMWIALKREHIVYKIPTAETMICFAKDLYEGKKDSLIECEMDILRTLQFNVVFPDPFSILSYDIAKCNRSQFITSKEFQLAYCCGSYMIDISLFDEDLMKISVVLFAAVAAETALYFAIEEVEDKIEPLWVNWRAPHTAKRYSDEDINAVRSLLIRRVADSQKCHSTFDIVFKKYNRSRYGRISHFLGHKVNSYLREA